MTYRSILAAAAILTGLLGPARAIDVAGVEFGAQTTLAGQTLQLNGAGVRYKFVVPVYTAGLYLAAPAATPDEVVAQPGAKRLRVVMLRDIDATELGKLFTRGMQDNVSRANFSKSIPGTLAMADIFSRHRRLAPGDQFSVDWLPGVGTQIMVNGVPEGAPIPAPEFFDALLGIWLGPRPAYEPLKDALLGRAAPAAPAGRH